MLFIRIIKSQLNLQSDSVRALRLKIKKAKKNINGEKINYEMLFIRIIKPKLNTQSDIVHALKLFLHTIEYLKPFNSLNTFTPFLLFIFIQFYHVVRT